MESDTGEAEAVFLLRAVHTADHRHIAVGYEIEALDFRGPGIVVFSHQQALASYQFLLAVEDARADAEVEAGGPAVGAGDYGGLPRTVGAVAVGNSVDHIIAFHHPDIVIAFGKQARSGKWIEKHGPAQPGGIAQYA